MKKPWLFVFIGLLLVALMYILLPTRPEKAKELDRVRSLNQEAVSMELLEEKALNSLSTNQRSELIFVKNKIKNAQNIADSVEQFKQLSSFYFKEKKYILAGHYAEKVAEMLQTDEAYSIAASTFAYAWKSPNIEDRERTYAIEQSRKMIESAISIAPEEVSHRVNLAISHVEHPPKDNPMQGIQMLLGLSKKYPENASVLFQLGRFGIQTGQYEKAVQRLEKAAALEPNRSETYCLLAEAYKALNKTEKMKESELRCN